MYVGLKMLRNFVTVTPKTPVLEAQKLLDESRLGMLLVVDGGKLLGYVRPEDLSASLPSIMTSLDKHEIKYLMSRLTVERIIRKDIKTIPPETEVEAAADMMFERNLAGLAVVDHQGQLIGYINRSVMLDVLVEEMGHREGGSRITFEANDRPGVLHEVAGIIAGMGLSIISTGTFFHGGKRIVVVRVDTRDASPIAAALQDRGYKVMGPMDFMHEWQ
ncbi:MAG: CBS domain-containing protein [Humidesulfovibrio sp.]|uniref:CBS domain-containing protein n=1 Tax=Humidesulfovibrio sp. TaxID=2910988 RepID=UPI00273677B2|nr:CBS domain-containing protein [Humidesulfovibrio sp.]MDP2848918.1 CBS domain-containing protein [Humidesulfovibrio sp.]